MPLAFYEASLLQRCGTTALTHYNADTSWLCGVEEIACLKAGLCVKIKLKLLFWLLASVASRTGAYSMLEPLLRSRRSAKFWLHFFLHKPVFPILNNIWYCRMGQLQSIFSLPDLRWFFHFFFYFETNKICYNLYTYFWFLEQDGDRSPLWRKSSRKCSLLWSSKWMNCI